ncbi:IclR family transcriptional regulator [Gracilibacillus sp. HCP3S3_G5_1]|uniref:IclR family transcriptional regulator n=1 Tax=unclassified Gracilibacillus TaxID=2625209 RepID=UPI003F8B4DB4
MSSKTVLKALNILEEFTSDNPSWGLRELSRKLDMSHTIVYRLVSTLVEKGYLFRNPNTQKYELGIKFIELSNVVEDNLKLKELIEPIMQEVATRTGESVVLTLLDREEGLFAKIVESQRHVRFSDSKGKRSPLYIGASHKTILAYIPEKSQHKIIQDGIDRGASQITSKEDICETLSMIRQVGWAYTSGETIPDVAAVAVPIFDYQQSILGSLSIGGPAYRLTEDVAESMANILMEYREELHSILKMVSLPTRRDYLINNL